MPWTQQGDSDSNWTQQASDQTDIFDGLIFDSAIFDASVELWVHGPDGVGDWTRQ